MRRKNIIKKCNSKICMLLLLVIFISGCSDSDRPSGGADVSIPSVSATNPEDSATGVAMDFCTQPSFAAPDRFVLADFFLAPALC